jgi:hypothetical protein
MVRGRHRLVVLMLAAFGVLSVGNDTVEGSTSGALAAPEIIIYHGGALERPIVVASFAENHTLLLTAGPHERLRQGTAPPLEKRPSIDLALFWGIGWRAYAASPAFLASLTPAHADQHGKLYPAVPGAYAIVSIGAITGPVSDSGLAMLRRHGIPTRARSR